MHPKVGPKVLPHQPLNPNWTKASWFISKVIDGVRHIIEQQLGCKRFENSQPENIEMSKTCVTFQLQNIFFWSFIPGRKKTLFNVEYEDIQIFSGDQEPMLKCKSSSTFFQVTDYTFFNFLMLCLEGLVFRPTICFLCAGISRFLAQNRHNFEIHVGWVNDSDLRIRKAGRSENFPQEDPCAFNESWSFVKQQKSFEILDHHDHHLTNTGERLSATRIWSKKPRNETVEQLAALQSQYQLLGSCWRSWCKKGSWRFLKGQKNHI